MEYRNPQKTFDVAIDCEINHPIYGWIPFTAYPDDRGADFDVATLYAKLASDPNTKPCSALPPAPPLSAPVPTLDELMARLAEIQEQIIALKPVK